MNNPMMILLGPPVWVWPLLALLVWLGLRASRDRTTHVASVYWFPFLGILSVFAIRRMEAPAYVWVIYGLALLAGGALGYRLQRRWIAECRGSIVSLRGEWLTLVTVLAVFSANFVTGTMRAVAPEIYASPGFEAGFALAVGVVSGLFCGRALRVFTTTRQPGVKMAPAWPDAGAPNQP